MAVPCGSSVTMRVSWTWVVFIAAVVITVIGAITGTTWVALLGSVVSIGLIVVNSYRSRQMRSGQTYSSKGSLFDDDEQ
jgi:O-antigen/teichoic acid export membrane protein